MRASTRLLARGLAAAIALAAASGCGPGRPSAPPGAPSVVLVSVDTLRADRVGAYGADYGATPRIDAVAASGVRALKAIAPAPITLPSHATLFTGLYPPRHGVRHNGIFRLDAEHTTLAERFQASGWATGAFVGAFVLDARFGLDQGFDRYDDEFGATRASSTGYPERGAAEVTDAALAWLADQDGPFFLFVHYYDPHADYRPPPPWTERFAGRPYEGEVAYVDHEVGRLIDAVRGSAAGERAVVAITSDHGESLGEHGERTHSYTLYDATLSVPLVLAGPGVPAGRTVPGVVSTASLAPTLLGLAGLPPFADVDGEDLRARWDAPAEGAPGEAYAETLATQLDHGWAPLHALRTARLHYVRAPRAELYDVAADPGEVRNLLGGPTRAEAGELDGRIAAVLEREAPLRTANVDSQTKEKLRALGYALADGPVAESGLDPKDGLPLVELYVEARAAFFAGDLDAAERRAQKLLAKSPDSAQAEMLLADVARRRNAPRDALAHAERAAQLLPQSAAFWSQVGDLRAELGDPTGALAAYREALSVDDSFAEARAGLMWMGAVFDDVEMAEKAAEAALSVRPDDPDIRLRVAQNYDKLGAAKEALAAYREVLEVDPGSSAAQMGIAIQCARLGRDADAEAALAAAGRYADEPNHRNRLAIAFAAHGRTDRAEALFRDVLLAHPAHANARRNLAELLRRSGRAAEAAALEASPPGAAPSQPGASGA
jgi:arylsulfatase A-like enzyme/tetratricopeptide (TPR) repeat protein